MKSPLIFTPISFPGLKVCKILSLTVIFKIDLILHLFLKNASKSAGEIKQIQIFGGVMRYPWKAFIASSYILSVKPFS